MPRADVDALAAGHTCIPVNLCYAVYYVDRIKLADRHAGTAAKAAEGTGLGTLPRNLVYDTAVHRADIFVTLRGLLAVALAVHKGDHSLRLPRIHSHDTGDHRCNSCSAHRALIYRSLTFCNGGGTA